jgi:hypothetical protein
MRRLVSVTGAVMFVLIGLTAHTTHAGAASPPPTYCATLNSIMSDNPKSPVDADPSFFTAKAKELRSSKPPADIKKAVTDFASGLDALAVAMKSMKGKPDLAAIRKGFGADSNYQQGLGGILRYLSTKCSGLAAATTAATASTAAKSASASAIPDSPAITAFASKMAGNPKAAPILQSCLVVTAMDLQQRLGKKADPESAGRIVQLATAVRAVDAKVGDAVSKAPLSAVAAWCKHTGFAN